jgi:glutamate-1-semialdehyde 2,1-aminomutase
MNRVGSMGCAFFNGEPVRDFQSALQSNTEAYGIYFREMLARGVYLAPSQFECFFVGLAHDREALDETIAAAGEALQVVKNALGF